MKYWVCTFCIIFTFTKAQKNVENQDLLWLRYALKMKINDRYQINTEIEERTYHSPWRQHQLVSRATLERKLEKDWSVNVGFTYFVQSLPHDPEVADYHNQIELRPHLGFGYQQKISEKFSVNHRIKSEFRFFEQENGRFEYGNNRTRYMLNVQYRFLPKFTLSAFDEIHLNIGKKIVKNVFDQNRIGGSIMYFPIPNLGFELGYLNWFQQRTSGVDFYNRDIIRFTVHQNINLKKK